MSSSPVPLKIHHVGKSCTLNLSRAKSSSRWCGVVVRRGLPAQVSSSSLDHGSKGRGLSPKALEFVETIDATPNFLNCIATEDASSCLMYDPETKRQSMAWCSPASPKLSLIKTILIAFFDCQGIIHKEFLVRRE
ncbi:hypothetical protein TNCV_1665361 [Trichonephila clavipes]|nr:hypothetical protein TNCV_1665361 [Trichonephila clavipes]